MCRQETRSKELQKGHRRVPKGNAKSPGTGARPSLLPLPEPSPFLRGQRLRDKPQGMRRWLGQLVLIQSTSPKSLSSNSPILSFYFTPTPPPRAALWWLARSPCSFHKEWGVCDAKPLSPLFPRVVGHAGSGPALGSAWVLTSPPQLPRVQVPQPRPAGGAGLVDTPSRRVLAACLEEAPEQTLVLRGARRRSRPTPRDTPRTRLQAPVPSTGHALSRGCELPPATWQPQVGR